jgi:hypothetical protein
MKMHALNSVITAWVLSGHGHRTIRVGEAHFMTRMNLPAGEALLDVSPVEAMRLRFEETIDSISLPDSEHATGLEPSAFTLSESLMVCRAPGDAGEIEQMPVTQQQMNFNRTLREQFALRVERRLRDWVHLGVYSESWNLVTSYKVVTPRGTLIIR